MHHNVKLILHVFTTKKCGEYRTWMMKSQEKIIIISKFYAKEVSGILFFGSDFMDAICAKICFYREKYKCNTDGVIAAKL